MKKLVLLSSIFLAFVVTGYTEDTAKTASMKKAIVQTVNINDIKEFSKKEMLKKVPLNTDKLVFNTYFLEPRQLLNLHKHPATDELFYIVEGRGQFTVGNEQIMVDSGSTVYGPANVSHGLVNSGNKEIVMISVQSPKPVQMTYIENSSVTCGVCGQENIVPDGAKVGDVIICPRCKAKLKLSKTKDGKWLATQI
jgi:mannose-6-phosphate isomerase-like protein (cupin superfamily)